MAAERTERTRVGQRPALGAARPPVERRQDGAPPSALTGLRRALRALGAAGVVGAV